jgi:hypothetical protein
MPGVPNSSVLLAALIAALAACSSETGDGVTPGGGSSAGSGGAGVAGSLAGSSPMTGGAGMAGVAGSSATTAGSGGLMSSGGTAGSASGAGGSGGANAAGSGGGGVGGAGGGGAGGGGLWGPNGPKKQWTCPAGPYPAQTFSAATDACPGFNYNYTYNEGPTWIASEGAFYFSNFKIYTPDGGDIIKFTPGQGCEVWQHDVGCNGLGVSPSGNVLAACHHSRAIMEYDVKTKQGRVVASMADGKMFDAPNDLIARSDGNIYFSNRTAENGNRPVGLGEALVRIDPTGVTSVILKGGLNGVALSPDETKLYVCGMGTFPLDAAGLPGAKGQPTPGGDGIAMDCAGAITANGTNSAYGGPDGKTLLVVGGGTMARTMQATVPGLP